MLRTELTAAVGQTAELVPVQVSVASPGNFMRSNNARYNLALIVSHWALALMILISLGFGWSPQYMPKLSNQMQSFLLNLHMSCGIVIAILIFIQFFLRIIVKPPSGKFIGIGWRLD
ncbi:MAG: cytochrome b/b6 domain-containing protein, partial [Methylocella sp.]